MKRKEEPFDLTQRTIFGLLSHNLFQLPFEPEDGVDWKAVFRESKQQAVAFQVFMDRGRLTRMLCGPQGCCFRPVLPGPPEPFHGRCGFLCGEKRF